MTQSPTEITAARQRVTALYSADVFGRAAKSWTAELTQHFRALETRSAPVLNWSDPAETVADALDSLSQTPLPYDAIDAWLQRFTDLLHTMLARGQNLHHPRYVGHQVPASVPLAGLFDALGSATNQVMAIYEMGPWATAVERAMIAQLGAEIGYRRDSFCGIVTHGGSLANLTALLTARNVAIEGVWRTGTTGSARPVLVVQQDVHYCVVRAAGILGIGTDEVIRIPVDERRKMRLDALDDALADLKRDGRTVIAVVAGACATPIGAFDPLNDIADICERHGVWFHVDAAHGGAVLLSDRYRQRVRGLERADSVVWDAHKMLFMPALCAFVFYRDRQHRFTAFEQDAPYLFDPTDPGIAEYDSGTQTIECTKRAAAFSLWGIWSLFGRQLFRDLVDVTFDLASLFHAKLSDADDFEPLHVPECNIQVFRYLPDFVRSWPAERLGQFQLELRRAVITSGRAYIVPVKMDGVGALRATLINPCTTGTDLDEVMNAIRHCAKEIT